MPMKTTTRAAKHPANPCSLFWLKGAKTPWRTGSEAIVARDRADPDTAHPGIVLPSARQRVVARDMASNAFVEVPTSVQLTVSSRRFARDHHRCGRLDAAIRAPRINAAAHP